MGFLAVVCGKSYLERVGNVSIPQGSVRGPTPF